MGHTDQVTYVAVAITNKSIVVSGSRDANLIVWDMETGEDLHLLQGHLGYVTCVKVAGDGSIAVSGEYTSEKKAGVVMERKKAVTRITLGSYEQLILMLLNDSIHLVISLKIGQHVGISLRF